MVDRVKRLEDYEGLLLIVFVAIYGTLAAAWELGGLMTLVSVIVILALTVIAIILSGRAGMIACHLWIVFVLTSALVLSASIRERFSLLFWPDGLVLTLIGSLSVGVSIAMYHRYIAPHIREVKQARSRLNDNI